MLSLGLPITPNNIITLFAWSYAEGGWFDNDATYNPLDTTQVAPGSHSINSVGVQAYTSLAQGIAATTQTLQNGYYPAILEGLRTSKPPSEMAVLIGQSPWGTNGIVVNECIPQATADFKTVQTYFFPPKVASRPAVVFPAAANLFKLVLPIDAMNKAHLVRVVHKTQQEIALKNGWHLWYYAVDKKFYPVLSKKLPKIVFVNKNWRQPLR
ncbi:MAG: hypothetical protein QXL94_00485 [Candidatus Parvarchaeum sp.]